MHKQGVGPTGQPVLHYSSCINATLMSYSDSIYFRGVRLCIIQNTLIVQSILTHKCLEENQEKHFHHLCQACLIHYFNQDQMALLTHVI